MNDKEAMKEALQTILREYKQAIDSTDLLTNSFTKFNMTDVVSAIDRKAINRIITVFDTYYKCKKKKKKA